MPNPILGILPPVRDRGLPDPLTYPASTLWAQIVCRGRLVTVRYQKHEFVHITRAFAAAVADCSPNGTLNKAALRALTRDWPLSKKLHIGARWVADGEEVHPPTCCDRCGAPLRRRRQPSTQR